MERRSVNTSSSPLIDIAEVHGNLQIKGWERTELLVRAQHESLDLEVEEDQARLECRSDCQINLPVGAQVRIGQVHGNLRIKLLEGRLSADQIQGNLSLRNVAQTQIEEVHGELFARYVNGDFQVERVLGNFKGRDLRGECSASQVTGNLDLRDVTGEIEVSAGGNAKVRLRALLGDVYQISSGGNLNFHIPEDQGAQVQMTSGAENIRVNVPGKMTTISQESHTLTLGDGGIQISLTAGGSIYLAAEEAEALGDEEFDLDLEEEFVGLSEEISQHIEKQMKALNDQMANLSNYTDRAGLTEEQIDRIMHRAQESTQRATQRAQEKMRQAQEKLERKLAAAQRKAEMRARAARQRHQERRQPEEAVDRTASQREARDVHDADAQGEASPDERLMILRMLAQKKITPQEAERLLAALEGK